MSKHAMVAGAALLALALAHAPARAEWRCDCTKIAGSCHASVEVKGSWVQVSSEERACARVEYFIDGQPFVALVVDGEHRQPWLTGAQAPDVLVQSCQVCQDHLLTPQAPATASSAAGTGAEAEAPSATSASTPLIQVAPTYPSAAGGRGGEVVVQLEVDAAGTVARAQVLEASPRGLFDASALDAAHRWRYAPGAARVVTARIAFAQRSGATAPAVAGDARATGPRNACVKEGNVDELIDIVQVQLLNGCAHPVLVRSCAEGFGERAGQWVCNDPIALVGRDDARDGQLGELATDRGRLRFGYATESYLSRPVGTRYAWIACAEGDSDCYGTADRWTEYLSAKSSGVDPRAGSDIDVAVQR